MNLTPEQEEKRRERAETLVKGVVSGLSAMQRTAVIEHLCGKSKTEACAIAGYKRPEKHQSRVFSSPAVQAVIAEYFFGPEMDVREVVGRLGQQGRAEYAEYIGADGTVDLARMKADGKLHLVKGISYTRTGQMVVSFYDAQSALVHVGRVHGIFKETAVNLNVDLTDLSDEELNELRKRL